jgi:hypothetical protein
MAFTLAPFDEGTDLVIATSGAVSFIRLAVGFDRGTQTTYLLNVALDWGRPTGGTEFSFLVDRSEPKRKGAGLLERCEYRFRRKKGSGRNIE